MTNGHNIHLGFLFGDIMTSIAIVGNNTSLFDRQYGGEIDKHDFVARMNRAAILTTKYFEYKSHGTRTDLWFMWRHKEYETLSFVRPPYCMQMAYWEELDDESIHLYPSTRYLNLQHELGSVPSTGLMVLDFLDSLEYEKISVYGYDWKATPTFTDIDRSIDNKLNASGSLHDFAREKQYCLDRFLSDRTRYCFRF